MRFEPVGFRYWLSQTNDLTIDTLPSMTLDFSRDRSNGLGETNCRFLKKILINGKYRKYKWHNTLMSALIPKLRLRLITGGAFRKLIELAQSRQPCLLAETTLCGV